MSYCQIIKFENGKADVMLRLGNAWRGAAFIWDSMYRMYLKDPLKEYDTWLGNSHTSDAPLWKLVERSDLLEYQRVVHCSTLDGAIVKRENFERYAAHLDEFHKAFTAKPGEFISHVGIFADAVREAAKNPAINAIGYHHTSVCENPWIGWDEKSGELVPYDLNTGDKHWDVYDHLAEWDRENAQKAAEAAGK